MHCIPVFLDVAAVVLIVFIITIQNLSVFVVTATQQQLIIALRARQVTTTRILTEIIESAPIARRNINTLWREVRQSPVGLQRRCSVISSSFVDISTGAFCGSRQQARSSLISFPPKYRLDKRHCVVGRASCPAPRLGMIVPAMMTAGANTNDDCDNDADDGEQQQQQQQLVAVDHIASILHTAVESISITTCATTSNNVYQSSYRRRILHESISTLQNLKIHAMTYDTVVDYDENANNIHTVSTYHEDKSIKELVTVLTYESITTINTIHKLIHRVNNKAMNKRNKGKPSSGHAWKALASVVSSTFSPLSLMNAMNSVQNLNNHSKNDNNDDEVNDNNLGNTLAILTIGLALSMNYSNTTATSISTLNDDSNDYTATMTKLIAGAILPGDEVTAVVNNNNGNVHSMARASVLGLLRLATIMNKSIENDGRCCIDLQIIARIENGFRVGSTLSRNSVNYGNNDDELSQAAANLLSSVYSGNNGGDDITDDNGNALPLSKDVIAPMLAIIANIRPWEYVQVEKLVRTAVSMDLWYSAEQLCDSAIDTVLSAHQSTTNEMYSKSIMTTISPYNEEDSGSKLITSIPQNSSAHIAAQIIIDMTLESRLYRRADTFATKYYSFGGPGRFAEARFMHALDTIGKIVKKRQVQLIDKQVERVDAMVDKVVGEDYSQRWGSVPQTSSHLQWRDSEAGSVLTMKVRIREFIFRRLRASNMHSAAARLASLWQMEYEQDPVQMMKELEQRRLTYLQWDDVGCPGNNVDNTTGIPLPDLISDPDDLLMQFNLLLDSSGSDVVIGFDCEWHESINFVALLQLSSTTNSLLLDIPALTVTKEGCEALRSTVGKLFSRSTDNYTQQQEQERVIGFSCKDDIKRLRASPCVPSTANHWFPQQQTLCVEDLRNVIAEMNPLGGGIGMKLLGLSRACEIFLGGKGLEKNEQCSDWLCRPLTREQREYACLDAWACAAIYSKIINSLNKDAKYGGRMREVKDQK